MRPGVRRTTDNALRITHWILLSSNLQTIENMSSMSLRNSVIRSVAIGLVWSLVDGHGRLMEPPSRSSLWREDPRGAINYNDNALYCGGFQHQWEVNGGRCGICGDRWEGPRENEAGGKYAKGIITRTYDQADVIDVSVEITANHKGWFEFRICPNNDVTTPATQACLDNYLLPLAVNGNTRHFINSSPGFHDVRLQLPSNLICSQCVLQWKYNTGNSWGVDDDGHGCVGCGRQEQFYGCSDVEILGDDNARVSTTEDIGTTSTPTAGPTTRTTSLLTILSTGQSTEGATSTSMIADNTATVHRTEPTSTTTQATTTQPTETTTTTTQATTTQPTETTTTTTTQATTTQPTETTTTTTQATTTQPTETTTSTQQTTTTMTTASPPGCRAIGVWKRVPGMNNWCVINCRAGYCPQTHCTCSSSPSAPRKQCRATSFWAHSPGMNDWCDANCNAGYCPISHCECS